MTYRATAVQQAIYEALTGDGGLMGAVSGVFSHVPRETAFPYLVIGDVDVRPMNTVDADGAEYRCSVICYSRGNGHREAQEIMALVAGALSEDAVSVSGAEVVEVRFMDASARLERDGVTYTAAGRFRVTVRDQAA